MEPEKSVEILIEKPMGEDSEVTKKVLVETVQQEPVISRFIEEDLLLQKSQLEESLNQVNERLSYFKTSN